MSPDEIRIGMLVQDNRDRSRRGRVSDGPARKNGLMKAFVDWENGSASWTTTDLLAPATAARTVKELLVAGAFGGYEDFVRNYTHRKLLAPVDDTLYSLSASRTQLLAHQFKPLIRFLDSMHGDVP
jgi:hypothetical protein